MTEQKRVVRRWIAFGSVGVAGFGVQLAALVLLAGWLETNYLLATAIAVELAVLHNFVWHQRWTWSDRDAGDVTQILGRLLRYNTGTALTSIGGNLLLMWVFVSRFGIHYAIANVLAVLLLSIANYVYCNRLVFRSGRVIRHPERRPGSWSVRSFARAQRHPRRRQVPSRR